MRPCRNVAHGVPGTDCKTCLRLQCMRSTRRAGNGGLKSPVLKVDLGAISGWLSNIPPIPRSKDRGDSSPTEAISVNTIMSLEAGLTWPIVLNVTPAPKALSQIVTAALLRLPLRRADTETAPPYWATRPLDRTIRASTLAANLPPQPRQPQQPGSQEPDGAGNGHRSAFIDHHVVDAGKEYGPP